jgi:hypothetical protein
MTNPKMGKGKLAVSESPEKEPTNIGGPYYISPVNIYSSVRPHHG